jgi:hypothetical protein
VLDLLFSVTEPILGKLTQAPAIMIDRQPRPATPKSDHHRDRPYHSIVAGQTTSLQMWSGQPGRYAAEKLDSIVQKLET